MEDKAKLSAAQMLEVLKYELEVASHHVAAQVEKRESARERERGGERVCVWDSNMSLRLPRTTWLCR